MHRIVVTVDSYALTDRHRTMPAKAVTIKVVNEAVSEGNGNPETNGGEGNDNPEQNGGEGNDNPETNGGGGS